MKFFNDYETYVQDTEPPKNFHVWTGLGTISALLGKKCYIPQGYFTIHPNLYIVLVGPAGVKKSSSMNIGKKILRSLKGFPLAPSSTTREALLMTLADNKITYKFQGREQFYHQCSAFVTELQEFIGGKHINQAMVGVMTALWDEPEFEYKTANREPVIIPSPYFTLLGCCTKDWITTKLKSDVISDGFSRRVVFVLEDKRAGFQPWPTMNEEKERAFEDMVKESKRMATLIGKFRFTDPALSLWDDMYRDIQKEVDTKDAYVQNYYSTKQSLMFKVAMCLSAASGNHMRVDKALLQLVHEIFLATESNLLEVFSGMGNNELSAYQQEVLNFISEEAGRGNKVKIPELTNKFSRDLNAQQLEEVINVLYARNVMRLGMSGDFELVTSIKKEKRKDLFSMIRNYKPNLSEPCSSSKKSELSRMVDTATYTRNIDNDSRLQTMKTGVLASSDDLKRTVT